MKYTAPILTLFLATLLTAHADEPTVAQVQITADYLLVDPATATELTLSATAPASAAACRAALLTLLTDGKSTSLGSVTVTTKSGQRATAESVQELIYATEYDPAAGRAASSPSVPVNQSGVDIPTPTSFEMKPIGLRMEVDPIVSADGKVIDINAAPECSRHFGSVPQQKLKTPDGEQITMEAPKVYSMKVQSAVSLSDGGSAIMGVLLPPDEKGDADNTKRVLLFLSAKVLR